MPAAAAAAAVDGTGDIDIKGNGVVKKHDDAVPVAQAQPSSKRPTRSPSSTKPSIRSFLLLFVPYCYFLARYALLLHCKLRVLTHIAVQ